MNTICDLARVNMRWVCRSDIIMLHACNGNLLTLCRKFGDLTGQYVSSVRFLDRIDQDTINDDYIYAKNDDLLWSYECSDCRYCE